LSSILPQDDAPQPATAHDRFWTGRDLAIGLALVVLWRGLALIPHEWWRGLPHWFPVGLLSTAEQITLLVFPLIVVRRRGADKFRWPNFKKFVLEAALSIPVVLALLMLLITAGVILNRLAPHTRVTPEAFEQAAWSGDYPFLIVVGFLAVTVAPLCEEVFFRGFLYDALRSRMPVVLAAILQSALFAALHTFGALHNVAVFFLGLILTAVYQWRKTLLAPIFVHAGNNLIAMLGLVVVMVLYANSPVLGVIGHDHEEGCEVERFTPDSGAEKAGIAPGDVITELDGERIAGFAQLSDAIRKHRIGDRVTVGINRKGDHLKLAVVLSKRPQTE
jgi:membrane protease YdiL (CAAX protease family)